MLVSSVVGSFMAYSSELPPNVRAAMDLIKADDILAGVKVLSADDMEGRGAGTAGEKRAADWIARQFKSLGLQTVGDSYFQEIEMVGYRKTASSLTLQGANGAIPYGSEKTLTYWSSSQKEQIALADIPLVFVGYGVEAPEYKWDDFKGHDIAGKILVFLNSDPPVSENGQDLFGGESRTYYGRWTYKFEQAMKHGAAGAMVIHTTPSAGYGWSVIGHAGIEEGFALPLPNTGFQLDFLAWVHQDLAQELAKTAGSSLEEWFESAKSRSFQPVDLPIKLSTTMQVEMRKTKTQNVMAVWPGSHEKKKSEYVVFSAHYDHLGIVEHDGQEDKIFNGAWDNALGTSSIISIARGFAKGKVETDRSILFLACAAEESGSLGSHWFVARPPMPIESLVGNINIDMPQVLGLTHDMAAIGYQTNSLGDALVKVAESFPGGKVIVRGDLDPNAGSFYRSDQVNFAKAGIPAVFLNPGTEFVVTPPMSLVDYESLKYHQAADEVDEYWNLSGCERDMKVAFLLAYRVANAELLPRWKPGNEFEAKWLKLHGPKAKK